MKRIILLIPALNAGGAERVMCTLANEWCKENDVTIVTFNDGKCFYKLKNEVKVAGINEQIKGKGIKRLLAIPVTEIRRFNKIKNYIKTENPDVVLSFCYTTNIMATFLCFYHITKKVVISERNDPTRYSPIIKCAINLLYRIPDELICQNKMVKEYFQKKRFRNKLTVLPNPVCFDDIPKEINENRAKEFVTVGRLIKQKNHSLLIDAFSQISKEFPEYNLKIFGNGPLFDDLEKRIKEKSLEKRITLMGEKKRVMCEVNNSNIFVLPSDFEGFPNVLIEAMATGMPVISSNFPTGIANDLVKKENGELFCVGDLDGLVDAMKTMINREPEFGDISKKNQQVALKYSSEKVAKDWYNSLV